MITAGDMPLLIVKFSKSPACGNVTSVGCVPLVTVILSERITIEAGRKFGTLFMCTQGITHLVKEVSYKLTRCNSYVLH